ncbi:MAG: DUF5107 domain-containing protein, partial [Planctomycetaceae bacterium]|nr:DUF5107 domain-containing protein [Planctomycetaceae bacterium]
MSNLRLFLCTAAVLIAAVQNASAQSPSPTQARECEVERTTYSFSDPSPIANPKIYPYFRFDTYAETPAQQKWKVVELENDFLKLTIYPEIGGKVWSAFVKAVDEELLF